MINTYDTKEMLDNPEKYAQEDMDLVVYEGNGFVAMLGIDDDNNYYLCFEDDEVTEDYYMADYPLDNNSLYELFCVAKREWEKVYG